MVATPASNRPDSTVLDRIDSADNVCLAVTTLIAAIVLGAWVVPGVASALPRGWSLMKVNTAVCILLCTASLTLFRQRRGTRPRVTGRVCASVAALLAGIALFEHWSGRITGVATLLAPDSGAPLPGLMSMQTALFLVLLGSSLWIDRTRQELVGHVLDALSAALVMLTLTLIAGYIFGALRIFGQSSATRTSPQTLLCMALLTFVQTSRRAPYGVFSVLLGLGIGSRFARLALPISLILSYAIVIGGESLLTTGILTLPYAAAVTASSMAALMFVLIVMEGRRINGLERELRDLSLSDELTGVHNRRGFYLLGDQALRSARRAAWPLTVLFFDADGLKQVNDTLGHDVGSKLLVDIATLLRANFRASDIVARIGGDEFVVMVQAHQDELTAGLHRLRLATDAANGAGDKPYRISFSVGGATSEPSSDESLVELVERADAAMYEDKKRRRVS